MELSEIKRQAQAAREFTHTVDAATFTLRMPTRFEGQLAARECERGERHEVYALRVERRLLLSAVVGWSGVLVKDVLPGHPNDDALVFEPGAVEALADARPGVFAVLGKELFTRMAAASALQEAAEKN